MSIPRLQCPQCRLSWAAPPPGRPTRPSRSLHKRLSPPQFPLPKVPGVPTLGPPVLEPWRYWKRSGSGPESGPSSSTAILFYECKRECWVRVTFGFVLSGVSFDPGLGAERVPQGAAFTPMMTACHRRRNASWAEGHKAAAKARHQPTSSRCFDRRTGGRWRLLSSASAFIKGGTLASGLPGDRHGAAVGRAEKLAAPLGRRRLGLCPAREWEWLASGLLKTRGQLSW